MAYTSEELQKGLDAFIQSDVDVEDLRERRNLEIALQVLNDLFKRINIYEPRFGSSFAEEKSRVENVHVLSANHVEARVYLDQIELFLVTENGAPKQAAFIDLKAERSKIFCIWSEFLTASGHLSARKMRERFQTILSQSVNRTPWTDRNVNVSMSRTQPRLIINDDLIMDVYPAFQLEEYWPKSGRSRFFYQGQRQPNEKCMKIDLLAKETGSTQPYSTDRDAWQFDFTKMYKLFTGLEQRELCFKIIERIIRIRLSQICSFIDQSLLRTVFMYTCEKRLSDKSWAMDKVPERINSFLLQLTASLQNGCLPHFYLSNVNLLEDRRPKEIRVALRETWKLARDFCTNPHFFEENLGGINVRTD